MTADRVPAVPGLPGGVRLRHGDLYGILVIEWPADGSPRHVLNGSECSLYETGLDGTERQLPGVTRLTVHAAVAEQVTADVETLVTPGGEPVTSFQGPGGTVQADEDGGYVTAVFRYLVAGMRTRDRA